MEMDPEVARRLLVEGATLILLNLPEGTEFGIDMKFWNTGENFKGVKMIPPGVHVVYYSSCGKYGDVAPRVSFAYDFKQSEFLVKKWDPKTEDISSVETSPEDVERLKANLQNLDRFLGPYPYDMYETWRKLSNHVDGSVVQRVTPESGLIRSALELVCTAEKSPVGRRNGRTRTVEQKEEELLPELTPLPGSALRLTPIPEKGFPDGCSPEDITRHSLDQSFTLNEMLSNVGSDDQFLGELQFSFLCFLLGHSLEALEHWRSLVQTVCKCRSAVIKRRQLYSKFLTVIEAQLGQVPEDFLVDIVSSNNVVYASLRELFRTMEESPEVEGRLKCGAERLQHWLTQKFCWDFSDLELETGDEAPVIVELSV